MKNVESNRTLQVSRVERKLRPRTNPKGRKINNNQRVLDGSSCPMNQSSASKSSHLAMLLHNTIRVQYICFAVFMYRIHIL
jgi:hypothetical protein